MAGQNIFHLVPISAHKMIAIAFIWTDGDPDAAEQTVCGVSVSVVYWPVRISDYLT